MNWTLIPAIHLDVLKLEEWIKQLLRTAEATKRCRCGSKTFPDSQRTARFAMMLARRLFCNLNDAAKMPFHLAGRGPLQNIDQRLCEWL